MGATVEEDQAVVYEASEKKAFENVVAETGLPLHSITNTVVLLESGATVPFISRYRKERTGNLDETQIRLVSDKWEYFLELEKRKEYVIKTIHDQKKLTPELFGHITESKEKQRIEDLYLPFKPKKRTKATVAVEKGLGGLADLILSQTVTEGDVSVIFREYVNVEAGLKTVEDVIDGALDIVVEAIADNAHIRGFIRTLLETKGLLVTTVRKGFKDQKTKFEMYYDYQEPLSKVPSHRLLAIRRGTKEKVLAWSIQVEETEALKFMRDSLIKNPDSIFSFDLKEGIKRAFKKLLISLEPEAFSNRMQQAEEDAIQVFSKNLHNLLLDPPAGNHIMMGIDPGYRSGCKVVVIDSSGDFKAYEAIFPNDPQCEVEEAESLIVGFVKKFAVELIAIGNGTASRETFSFVNKVIKANKLNAKVIMVSEAGASVYSASEVAIKEFPKLDVTVRGAISIARRLQDPLAELVKIDAKSIGVGQYQHDVNQVKLKKSLDAVVESCVNYVGVEVNTASSELLGYVSGIGPALADNIVKYRAEKGAFKNRFDLLRVDKLGEKAFEQCAGFLRIRASNNPLDNSAIHPERYDLIKKMAIDTGVHLDKLIGNDGAISCIDINTYVSDDIGLPTLEDIISELMKPGLDPRSEFKNIEFKDEIQHIEDLKEGMILEGRISNVTNFGAFCDIGVHQDGLIHISKLSNTFVKDPHEEVSVGDTVKVKVLGIDMDLKRISLERLI
jgi:protein Tex